MTASDTAGPNSSANAGQLLYLSRADVEALCLPPAEVIAAVTDALRELGSGAAEMPAKPGIHTRPDSFIHAMPAYLPSLGAAGIKWISGYPANTARGLPYISGLLTLNDPGTGLPLCVMDATWITAARTGAATAVAARFLARPDSRSLAILGCGVQGRSNLEMLRTELPGLCEVRAFDIRAETASSYAAWAERAFGVTVRVAASPREAVQGADIVVTAGPILQEPSPVIEPGWLAEGVFCCTLDFDSYVTPEAMEACPRRLTDELAQLAYYRKAGYFRRTPPIEEDLGMLLTGRIPGRSNPGERILAVNLGLAVEDMACAVRLYERATRQGAGVRLPL
ncbi:MAG: ornithine cyclodeaminase family protein [Candidatus Wallbacteria bacterium]|nr:ornithine cyclodeaminase family protein [Candidatus Wallbacteria bacterium]